MLILEKSLNCLSKEKKKKYIKGRRTTSSIVGRGEKKKRACKTRKG